MLRKRACFVVCVSSLTFGACTPETLSQLSLDVPDFEIATRGPQRPSTAPSKAPKEKNKGPKKPKGKPTATPSPEPSLNPTPQPTAEPTATPTPVPTSSPSTVPTAEPTVEPTTTPTALPTVNPTTEPTASPTPSPTPQPTADPTVTPTPEPTPSPSPIPTTEPTTEPTATPRPSAPPPQDGQPVLSLNGSLQGKALFPADNAWNQAIDQAPVDPNSDNLIASIGLSRNLHPDFGANWNGGPFGIPYVVVDSQQPQVNINFTHYGSESDPGPYPVPPDAPIEGGINATGDRHILVVERDSWKLYELFYAFPNADGSYEAASGAVFDLNSNAQRPAGWTSADAAGLPILPGLVRYDEVVEQGEIKHALRFTAARTRRAYTAPARHFASSHTDPNLPPMGMRVRLKADFDISSFPADAQVVLRALKKYGMILADNGSNWFVSGTADARWDDAAMNTLKQVHGENFEVVQMGEIVTD